MSRLLSSLSLLVRPHVSYLPITPLSRAMSTKTETTFTTIIQTHSCTYPGEDLAHETNSDADDYSPSSVTLSGGTAVRLPQPEYDLTGEGERVRAGERWVEQLATMSEAFVRADREQGGKRSLEELQRETVRMEMEEEERRRGKGGGDGGKMTA